MSELTRRLKPQEYRLLQLELLDLATMATSVDEYVGITNAIYIDCDSVEVII